MYFNLNYKNMKKNLLSIVFLLTTTLTAFGQPPCFGIYPLLDDFESYTNQTGGAITGGLIQWQQTPSNTFTIYSNHGTFGSKGLTKALNNFATIDSIVTPQVGPLTTTTEISFDYRIAQYTGGFATGTPTLSSNFEFKVYASLVSMPSITVPIITINSSNHVASTNFIHKTIAVPSIAASQCIYLTILVKRGSAGDFNVDIDNLSVSAAGTTVGLNSNLSNTSKFNILNDNLNRTIKLNSETSITEVQIFAIDGKEVYNSKTYLSNQNIEFTHSGVYIIQCKVDGIIERKKIVIQ